MTTTALSKDQLYAYKAAVRDGAPATLVMRFDGLGTSVSYQGILQTVPSQRGLGKVTLVPVNYEADEQPSDSPPISVEMDLDAANGLTLECGGASVTMRWRTEAIEAELTVDVDPA